MTFRQPRNWSLPTIGRGRDTRDLVPQGHHGNRGALTISIPKKLGESVLAKWAKGATYLHMKLDRRASDPSTLIVKPALPNEFGRKFTLGNSANNRDYRIFFDSGNYKWIEEIEAFAATETTANLTEEGIIVALPPVSKRVKLIPTEYRARRQTRINWRRREEPEPVVESPPPPASSGTLYLVMVPHETEEQFHTLLRFLRLEALKE